MSDETSDITTIGGEVAISGGCVAPQSLAVRFRADGAQIAVTWEDHHLLTGGGAATGFARITPARFEAFAAELRTILDAPAEPPSYASSAYGVSVYLRLSEGLLKGSASEMAEGPPLALLMAAIKAFVVDVRGDPETVEIDEELDEEPLSSRRGGLGWTPVLLALLLAAALAVFLYGLSN